MPTKWYQKEIPESPVFISGHPMRFDILETSDPILVTELDKCAARGIGGVMAITQEQYKSESEKKTLQNLSNGSSKLPHRQEISALQLDARRVVEAVGNPAPRGGMFSRPQVPTDSHRENGNSHQQMPEPIEIPAPASFVIKQPPTAKIGKAKSKLET